MIGDHQKGFLLVPCIPLIKLHTMDTLASYNIGYDCFWSIIYRVIVLICVHRYRIYSGMIATLPPPPRFPSQSWGCVIFPGTDCHQSSTIPPWPMCVTIQGQTATSHQPFHPGLCVSLSRGRLPPVINHSTLAYVCHYPGADCHQSSTIPP